MPVYRVAIRTQRGDGTRPVDNALTAQLREAGLDSLRSARQERLFLLEGPLSRTDADSIARNLLIDPLIEAFALHHSEHPPAPDDPLASACFEIHPRPGVMDPVAETTLAELRAAGYRVDSVRTGRRLLLDGDFVATDARQTIIRAIANDCIETVVAGTAGVQPAPQPAVFEFRLRHVAIRGLDDSALQKLSRDGHLFLSLDEMRAVRDYFERLGREPTDLELETVAQTWSEHCVHKTLKSEVLYRGAPFPGAAGHDAAAARSSERDTVEIRYTNLLKDTIARATHELIAAGRGPECLSVFEDNAGVIGFDADVAVAFKVETHNHPSAIEPYGGAATGVGGCIRDVLGCGLGARPIANTDVFCVAPEDWPAGKLPRGVLHPRRVLRGVVRGVADYGNRMGIPTVNCAVVFDPRYLGNPLVYCGCVGIIPRAMIHKEPRAGDAVVLVGGRTGRDGIHGATFSSAELTDTHADEFSHAVQIGNAITEKRVMDAILRARDDVGGCLYNAITDCGAGGLSSAVGEMAREVGATIELERVPLKYAGLRYDEIWISEAQERMVLAVPAENLERFLATMRAEEAEATVIGRFGPPAAGEPTAAPRLMVRYEQTVVGDLNLRFLHEGLPRRTRAATWSPPTTAPTRPSPAPRGEWLGRLQAHLRSPDIASKEWIIRAYDHEVQGGSVVKPLGGRGCGPNDAAVLRPRLDGFAGVAVGCGLAPALFDLDPYWMAVASIDEALRNVVCVGGDPRRTAILDNFCWGGVDDPHALGTLVRACQACYDAASLFGTPFVSGKDSLNNQFAVDRADLPALLEVISNYVDDPQQPTPERTFLSPAGWLATQQRLHATARLAIPGTLLISALSLIDDVRRCTSADLKRAGHRVYLVGALPQVPTPLAEALRVHHAVAAAIRAGLATACHDVSEGGWLTSLAEMAIGGDCGFSVECDSPSDIDPFEPCNAGYLIESADEPELRRVLADLPLRVVATVRDDQRVSCGSEVLDVAALRAAWSAADGGAPSAAARR